MFDGLISWFRDRLFSRRARDANDLRQTGVRVRPPSERPTAAGTRRVRPQQTGGRTSDLRVDTLHGGRIEDAGPGKNVLVRSKYLREDSGTHEVLKIIDETAVVEEDDGGFDPYNTGRFDRSRNWNNRTRK